MTRNPASVSPPVVLTVAGSDSGGGAGIQADIKTIEAAGAFGTSVVTSVTAQNTTGVESTHILPTEEIRAQMGAVFSDFEVSAFKTGMLATGEIIDLVADRVRETDAPVVVDPVMVAESGDRLLESEAEASYRDLIAEATLAAPNAEEAEVLTGIGVTDPETAREAGEAIVEMGADGALVTGGHVSGEDIVDVLVSEETVERIRHPRVDTEATHGSGCTLSAAIATRLGSGDDLSEAVRAGIDLLARAVRYNLDVGQGPGAVHHMVAARDRAERQPTVERVEAIVQQFVREDVSPLVPEVGMNVAGATPFAEIPAEVAAVEGRINRTLDGVEPTRGVRMGASTHVAGFLIAAREYDPDLRFAVNCRYDEEVATALSALDGEVVEADPESGADDTDHGQVRPEAATSEAFEAAEGTPVAVVDAGGVGREATVKLLAEETTDLVERTLTLRDALGE